MARKKNPVDEFLIQVGDNIRRVRTRHGYTLEELGRDIGLDKSNMHRIEMGRNITLVTLLKISATLDVNPTDLLPSNVSIAADDVEKYIRLKRNSA